MHQYCFRIADVLMKVNIPQEITVEDAYTDYLVTEEDQDAGLQVDFVQAEDIFVPAGRVMYDAIVLVTDEDRGMCIYHHDAEAKDYFACVIQTEAGRYQCAVQKQDWWRFRYTSQLFEYMDIEYLLNRQHIMLLHSSHIMWRGKSILFSAPSGTGKSTQADLWHTYEKAEIINGDRTAIRCHDGEVYAYGIPYAGSSGIFINKSAQIGAIVVLRQAPDNSIRRMRKAEAFRMIYSESTVQGWDSVYIDNLCEILEEIVRKIPVYLLSCRPDQEAVEILRKELEIC